METSKNGAMVQRLQVCILSERKHNHSLSPTLFDRVPVVWDHDDTYDHNTKLYIMSIIVQHQ